MHRETINGGVDEERSKSSVGPCFSVPTGPTEADVARAVKVLRGWEATHSNGSPMIPSGTGTGTGTGADSGTGARADTDSDRGYRRQNDG